FCSSKFRAARRCRAWSRYASMIETTVGRLESGAGLVRNSTISSWNLSWASRLLFLPSARRMRRPETLTYQPSRSFQYQGLAIRATVAPLASGPEEAPRGPARVCERPALVAARAGVLYRVLYRASRNSRAGDGIRTHDVQLGKLAFYH